MGASGTSVLERYTTPLPCQDKVKGGFKHLFLLSPFCPINLLGRDLMCRLGIVLTSSEKGTDISRIEDHGELMVKYRPDMLLYAYEWCLSETGSINSQLVQDRMQIMKKSGSENVRKQIERLYWTHTKCAAAVSIPSELYRDYYEMYPSAPHISLAKSPEQEWQDLGLWVNKCNEAEGWTVLKQNYGLLRSLYIYKQIIKST